MTITLTDLRTAVRALIPNIPTSIVSDADMSVYAEQAIRRLSEDRPRVVTQQFDGDGGNFYQLTTALSLWVEGLSAIKRIYYPEPVIADDEGIQSLDPDIDYRLYNDGTAEFIRFTSAPALDKDVVVEFTTIWTINTLDSAITTTIPSRYENAMEYLTTSITARSQSAKTAGITSTEVPADIINYRTKSREYKQIADDFEKQYLQAIGAITGDKATAAAAIGRSAYDRTLSIGIGRMTHPR